MGSKRKQAVSPAQAAPHRRMLANGRALHSTFSVRRAPRTPGAAAPDELTSASDSHSDPRFQGRSMSMDNIEKNLFERFCRKPFDRESGTLFHSTLALTAYYFRTNSFKSFESFGLATLPQSKSLRRILVKLSAKHYGIAINNLRTILLNLNDKNLVIAIISSSFLKKISIYEYKHMKTSIMFSKGLVGLFNDLLKKAVQWDNDAIINSIEVAWLTTFLIHASKTKHYEPYNAALLTEYFELLDEFRSVLLKLQCSDLKVVFHFNHLYKYTQYLIGLLAKKSIREINNDPRLSYKLLRNWLLILPSSVHVMEYLKDPILRTLMNLYRCLTGILDNLLPKVVFYFLQRFTGGLSLLNDESQSHEFRVKLFDELGAAFSESPHLARESEILTKINLYCYRIHSFFNLRTNAWVVLYDHERVVSDYAFEFMTKDQISSSMLQRSLNEVPIRRFMTTRIDYNHYLHIPGAVRFEKNNENLRYLYSDRGRLLFDYNKQHYEDYLLSNASDTRAKRTGIDPLLQFHLVNTRDSGGALSTSTKQHTHNEVQDITYGMFFPQQISNIMVDNLSVAYQNYFSDVYQKAETDLIMKLNPNNGLLYDDRDPFSLDKDSKIFMLASQCFTKLDDSQKLSKWLTNYYDERNQELSGCFDDENDEDEDNERGSASERDSGADDSNDDDINFYDDLDERYFSL